MRLLMMTGGGAGAGVGAEGALLGGVERRSRERSLDRVRVVMTVRSGARKAGC